MLVNETFKQNNKPEKLCSRVYADSPRVYLPSVDVVVADGGCETSGSRVSTFTSTSDGTESSDSGSGLQFLLELETQENTRGWFLVGKISHMVYQVTILDQGTIQTGLFLTWGKYSNQ